ncbi:hypothetical protein E9993_04905 [Labilibacter sediminis]|nr:hypothetical protein E9993_04905 [Labilibacter sediminis]
MTDYDILKYLGLDISDQKVIFYDDKSNNYILELNEIKDISLDNAYIPLEKKLGFWFEKLFVQRSFMGILDSKTYNDDYRNIYDLEIELIDNRVLSRKVIDADITECKEFISEISKLITPHNLLDDQ